VVYRAESLVCVKYQQSIANWKLLGGLCRAWQSASRRDNPNPSNHQRYLLNERQLETRCM
jgi:hypothetical protein